MNSGARCVEGPGKVAGSAKPGWPGGGWENGGLARWAEGAGDAALETPPPLLVPGSSGHKRESRGSQSHPWLSPSRAVLTITALLTAPSPPQRCCISSTCTFYKLSVYPFIYVSHLSDTKISHFSSVTQSCPTLCDPMNRSMPGLPVHHQLPEFTQTHVHRVGDAISCSVVPFSSCPPPFPAS